MSERYQAIRERVYNLTRITAQGPDAQALAQLLKISSEPAAPLPSNEALAQFERARHDPAELVALDADD